MKMRFSHVPRLGTCGKVTHAVYYARLLREKAEVPPAYHAAHSRIMKEEIRKRFPNEEEALEHYDGFDAMTKAQRAILN